MAFKENMRLEQIYFSNLKSLIEVMKTWRGEEEPGKVYDIIENCIQADAAILLLYRNLGEEWNELTAILQKEMHDLEDLKAQMNEYHDELNEKIDEVNNYLLGLIRDLEMRVAALEARMDAVERDLASLVRNYILDLSLNNTEWELKYNGENVTFAQASEWAEHPHILWVRGELNNELTMLVPREYDTNAQTGIFEWASVGFVNSTIHEVNVTLLPDNSVQVVTSIFDYGSLINRVSSLESSVDQLEEDVTKIKNDVDDVKDRLTNAETDIDALEQTAQNHDSRITRLENEIPELYRVDCAYDGFYSRYNSVDEFGNSVSASDILAAANAGKFVYMRIGSVLDGNFIISGYGELYRVDSAEAKFREATGLTQDQTSLSWSVDGAEYTITTDGQTTKEGGFVVIPSGGGGAVSNVIIDPQNIDSFAVTDVQSGNPKNIVLEAEFKPNASEYANKKFALDAYFKPNSDFFSFVSDHNANGGIPLGIEIEVSSGNGAYAYNEVLYLVKDGTEGIAADPFERLFSLCKEFYITDSDFAKGNITFTIRFTIRNGNMTAPTQQELEETLMESVFCDLITEATA